MYQQQQHTEDSALAHSRTLLPALPPLIALWPRKSKQGGIRCWPSGCSDPALLHVRLCTRLGPRAARTEQAGGPPGFRCAWRLTACPAWPYLYPCAPHPVPPGPWLARECLWAVPFLPEHSFHAPTPSPQGLPGLAGARSLRACELTLGTELQGTPEPPELAGMIPKPVRRSFILPVGIFRPGGRCQTG